MLGHDVADRAAVQPVVVGQVRTDQAAEIRRDGTRSRRCPAPSKMALPLARLAASVSGASGPARAAAGRGGGGPRRRLELGLVLGHHAGVADQRRRQDVVVHDVDGGEHDRQVEAVEPPARQRVVELADAVGVVIEQLVAARADVGPCAIDRRSTRRRRPPVARRAAAPPDAAARRRSMRTTCTSDQR